MKAIWIGCGTALVTPFTESGAIDEKALRSLVLRQIKGGVNFLVPCGTTGESPTLTQEERCQIVDLVARVSNGQVPVLAGIGGNDTKVTVQIAKELTSAGADGVLAVTPYYNKPTQEGLFQHFSTISASIDSPVVLYNVPSRTGCNIEASTVKRLSEVENIVGIKEASADLSQMNIICRDTPDDFSVLSGDDALTLSLIAVGGNGVISVAANEVPSEMSALVNAALAHDFFRARDIHQRLLNLMQVNFVESNPIPVKVALEVMGLGTARYRLPLVKASSESRDKIVRVLSELGLCTES